MAVPTTGTIFYRVQCPPHYPARGYLRDGVDPAVADSHSLHVDHQPTLSTTENSTKQKQNNRVIAKEATKQRLIHAVSFSNLVLQVGFKTAVH